MPDAVALRLQGTLDWLRWLVPASADTGDPVPDADRIDRIAVLERLQASLEAVKAVEMVAFATSQTTEQLTLGVHPRAVGRGIADQIALACRVSPSEGSRRLHTARDLVLDMPHTLELLSRGEISGWTVRLITEQVSHLDRATRTQVDQALVAHRPETMSTKEAAATAKRLAYAADPEAAMARARQARTDRRVTVRPAPDTMSLLTGLLPVEHGVAFSPPSTPPSPSPRLMVTPGRRVRSWPTPLSNASPARPLPRMSGSRSGSSSRWVR